MELELQLLDLATLRLLSEEIRCLCLEGGMEKTFMRICIFSILNLWLGLDLRQLDQNQHPDRVIVQCLLVVT